MRRKNLRQSNYELLRFLSTFMIVLLHVVAGSVGKTIVDPSWEFTVCNAIDSITRFAVPLFVMLSGAFQLQNPKNASFSYYYPRIIKTILVPTLIWSIIYVGYQITYSLFLCKLGYLVYDDFYINFPLMQFLKGSPFYHLWYLYMALGLFAVTPPVIRLLNKKSPKQKLAIGIFMLIVGFLITEIVTLIWPLKFIQYLGYYIFGSIIIENKDKLLKWKTHFLLISIICTISIFYFTEILVRLGGDFFKPLYFYGFLSPFVIIGSLFIFAYFTCLNYRKRLILSLSKHSFTIYLCHALILDVLTNILQYLDVTLGIVARVPILTMAVFILSVILSNLINKFTKLFRPVNKKLT